jgi:hypothetical protein
MFLGERDADPLVFSPRDPAGARAAAEENARLCHTHSVAGLYGWKLREG